MGGKLELEFEFPEPIIQHIQTFLTGKEAARTSILSKSWRRAWLTRPNLDFDERDYIARGKISESKNYVKNTIDWYEQSKLKIESLKLCMIGNRSAELVKGLIVIALGKLGATRLSIQFNPSGRVVLPHEVLFGAGNLFGLSVTGCEIKLDGMEKKFRRLESLCLDEVWTTSDALCNLISCCPFIENLSLSRIRYDDDYDYGYLSCSEDVMWPRPVGPRPVGLTNTNLDRLRCLELCYKSFEILFPGDLLPRFPSLTDLTLHVKVRLDSFAQEGEVNISNYQEEDVQISNSSLERVFLEVSWYDNEIDDDDNWSNVAKHGSWRVPTVKLDVPRIRKFTFEGNIIPSLSIVSSSTREWESHVSVTRHGGPTPFWFGLLNEFLAELRLSKIYLSLQVYRCQGFDYKVGDVCVIRKHELENLTLDTTGLQSCYCYSLLDGFFRLCRPKLLTQTQKRDSRFPFGHPFHTPDHTQIIFDILCEVLNQGIHFKVSDPSLFLYGSLNGLKEVNVQIFDDDVMVWRPAIPLKSWLLLEDQKQRVRLVLNWNP